jgi:DNA excision repair protein ERCC-4
VASSDTLKTLPPLNAVDPAKVRPTLIIDTREQDPLPFTRLLARRGALATGDYSIAGCEALFSVERKSIQDLVGCCMGENRERFERELHRLRGFRFKRLLIVGTEEDIRAERYISRIKPQSVLATLAAFEVRYDCPVIWCATPEEASQAVERWAFWFSRELLLSANQLAVQITPIRSISGPS